MKERNTCYTYFRIGGYFDPDKISEILKLQPEESWKIGDERQNGTKYETALWTIGRCDDYDFEIEKQMEKTISVLQDKIDLLNRIKEEYDVTYFLEIVPKVYVGESTPCLAPSLAVIDFCHATRTKIDIDLYVYANPEANEQYTLFETIMNQKLYSLIITDTETEEEFGIGIFPDEKEAIDTAEYYLRNVQGFNEYPCEYRIETIDVIEESKENPDNEIWCVWGYNVTSDGDETDNTELFYRTKKEAEEAMPIIKEQYQRDNWEIYKNWIGRKNWTDGFTRA